MFETTKVDFQFVLILSQETIWKKNKANRRNESVILKHPETNMAPENGWLEDDFPFGKPYFQVRTLSFRDF